MIESSSTLGERLAFHRRRRGLSQVELGRLIGRSESWVSQVERDARKVDRLSVLIQVADVLNVSVAELAPDAPVADPPVEHVPYLSVLRLALTGHPALDVVLAPDRMSSTSSPASGTVGELTNRVGRAWELVHASRYSDAGPVLAELISDAERSARLCPMSQRAETFRLLAETYQAVSALLAKVDDAESAWIAGDRSLAAAEQAGDPALVVAAQYRLALGFLSTRRLLQARHAAKAAVDAAEPLLATSGQELVSVWGALHLVLAVAASRESNRREAWSHIAQAEDAADRLGSDRNDFGTEFGPTNVALHAVAVAVELGDAGEALDRADRIDSTGLSSERRARYLIDVARAYGQRRRGEEAVRALLDAERLAPEQVRDHVLVRELLRDLLQAEGRRTDPELRALATRAGVLV